MAGSSFGEREAEMAYEQELANRRAQEMIQRELAAQDVYSAADRAAMQAADEASRREYMNQAVAAATGENVVPLESSAGAYRTGGRSGVWMDGSGRLMNMAPGRPIDLGPTAGWSGFGGQGQFVGFPSAMPHVLYGGYMDTLAPYMQSLAPFLAAAMMRPAATAAPVTGGSATKTEQVARQPESNPLIDDIIARQQFADEIDRQVVAPSPAPTAPVAPQEAAPTEETLLDVPDWENDFDYTDPEWQERMQSSGIGDLSLGEAAGALGTVAGAAALPIGATSLAMRGLARYAPRAYQFLTNVLPRYTRPFPDTTAADFVAKATQAARAAKAARVQPSSVAASSLEGMMQRAATRKAADAAQREAANKLGDVWDLLNRSRYVDSVFNRHYGRKMTNEQIVKQIQRAKARARKNP